MPSIAGRQSPSGLRFVLSSLSAQCSTKHGKHFPSTTEEEEMMGQSLWSSQQAERTRQWWSRPLEWCKSQLRRVSAVGLQDCWVCRTQGSHHVVPAGAPGCAQGACSRRFRTQAFGGGLVRRTDYLMASGAQGLPGFVPSQSTFEASHLVPINLGPQPIFMPRITLISNTRTSPLES